MFRFGDLVWHSTYGLCVFLKYFGSNANVFCEKLYMVVMVRAEVLVSYQRDEWISVRRALPEMNEVVLAFNAKNASVAACHYEYGRFFNVVQSRVFNTTHWQTLPRLPKLNQICLNESGVEVNKYVILNHETEDEDVVLGFLEKCDSGVYLRWLGSSKPSKLKKFKTVAEAMARVRNDFGFPSAYLE